MEVLLIPGFWLNAESWVPVTDGLRREGFSVTALTLPGMSSTQESRSGIGLSHHVDAVVSVVDDCAGPVVLVGHSAGGAVAHAVADARRDKVLRVIFVDSFPLGDGQCVNADLRAVHGEIPLPEWSEFDDADLVDMSDDIRDEFRSHAVPVPVGAAHDHQRLSDPRRYDVPITIIACEFSGEQMRSWIAEGAEWTAELAAMKDVEYIDLPTGHWPQFTRPDDLVAAISAALDDVAVPRD